MLWSRWLTPACAAAALSGCGGVAEDTPGNHVDDSADAGSLGTDAGVEPPVCPRLQPEPATPCSGDLDCFYGEHGDCAYGSGGIETHYVCKDGVWTPETRGSCPPPSENDAGSATCDLLGKWQIFDNSADSLGFLVLSQGEADEYLIDFPDVEPPKPDPCPQDPLLVESFLNMNVTVDPIGCTMQPAWYRYSVDSCFESNLESMEYSFTINNDIGTGTQSFTFETDGHNNAQTTIQDVTIERVL